MTTFLGGGGILLPEIVITFLPIETGCLGGNSRITSGSGVHGLFGCWRITSGGAGGARVLASCVIIISPGAGGVGGRKYLTASS